MTPLLGSVIYILDPLLNNDVLPNCEALLILTVLIDLTRLPIIWLEMIKIKKWIRND